MTEGRTPAPEAAIPIDFKLKLADQRLDITWKDGHESRLDLALLRRECPCATCRTEREARSANPLQILKFDPASLKVVDARLVGNYALQLYWSDGHQAGIYEFKFLRRLG